MADIFMAIIFTLGVFILIGLGLLCLILWAKFCAERGWWQLYAFPFVALMFGWLVVLAHKHKPWEGMF